MTERKRAAKLYESFREAKPDKVLQLEIDIPKTVLVIGHMESLDYRTTHRRKSTLYRHGFEPGSRPLLCVSPDGTQLLLIGGRYKFTDRGIVDLDAKGRLILDPKHGKRI